MMQVYFQNSFISLTYDLELQLGIARWRGHLRGPELREAYMLCQELVDRYALTRWLADDRKMQSIDPVDLEWSLQVIVPQIAASSILRMARLPSFSEENREAVDMMIDKGHSYDMDLAFRDFLDEQEAMEWLLKPF
ncbi:hypothetical protein [Botryobacter ruber]|uniref:hypothetical protein n=1 Tax=Botryobacter ruber TaxID=2171629 RepID=UPI001F0C12D1|nr:hypothetical protein [Botryobacter ruber]